MRPMRSALNEIQYLRGGENYEIDLRNQNRYRVKVKEPMGTTSYCFSIPIYQAASGRLITTAVEENAQEWRIEGTNCTEIVLEDQYVLENQSEKVMITVSEMQKERGITLIPTLNGLRLSVRGSRLKLILTFQNREYEMYWGVTALSFMREKFIPCLCVTPLLAWNREGIGVPVMVTCTAMGNQGYELELYSAEKTKELWAEISFYEPKLFQDTTVQSAKPNQNNAYGAVAFLGETEMLGEQWMYSRPDFSKIPELYSERVERALLHIPVFYGTGEHVRVFTPNARFCSFGSTWNNRIPHSTDSFSAKCGERYLTLDVTRLFTGHSGSGLIYNEGIVLKKEKNENSFIALSTGDCVCAPQILEISCK